MSLLIATVGRTSVFALPVFSTAEYFSVPRHARWPLYLRAALLMERLEV